MIGALRGSLERMLVQTGVLSLFEDDPSAEPAFSPELLKHESHLLTWLPYRSYRDAERVFINRDSIGFCLEVAPQTGADATMAQLLKALYAGLPTHTSIQFHLFATPHVQDILKRYAALRRADEGAPGEAIAWGRAARNDNVFRQMARRRYAHLLNGAFHPIVPGSPVLIRDFRLAVSVSLPGSIENLNQLDALLTLRESMSAVLRNAAFGNSDWRAADLINWVADLVNPQRMLGERAALTYDEGVELRDQCVNRDTASDWRQKDRVCLSKAGAADVAVEARLFSIRSFPERFGLWNMGGLIGDMFQASLQVPCPFLITMGVLVPDAQAMRSNALTQSVKANQDAKSDIAQYSPGMAEKKRDWEEARAALNRGGKLVHLYHQIALFARPGQSARAERQLRDIWRARGFDLTLDACMQQQALIASLPMTLSRPFFRDLMRMKRESLKTSGNAVHLAPLIAEPKGSSTPVLIGVGRRGQLITLDFFDNKMGGKSVSIVGATGSGKSVALGEIATAYLSTGALVRMFDRGRSFERLAARLGGQFLRFSPEYRVGVNPFSLVSEPVLVEGKPEGGIDDDIAMLQPLLAKMASPNAALDPTLYATLATVIKEEYVRRGRAMTVTDVRDRYAKGRLYEDRPIDQRYFDLADMLAPFSKGGPYERYFEGPATLDFGNDFIVFEMQDLAANAHLRAVIQMILLYKITQEMLQDRVRKKLFIMDEAREALAGSGPDDRILAEFIEALYIRVRKYNGCAITATHDVSHYYVSAAGATVFNQSDFIFMGSQSESSIAAAANNDSFVMDDSLKRLLATVRGEEGQFSEWYVHSPLFRGVFRLFINPSTLLLYSNDADNNIALDARTAAGMSVVEAIDDLLRERGVVECR